MRQVPYGAVFPMLAVQGMEKTNTKKYSGQQGRKNSTPRLFLFTGIIG